MIATTSSHHSLRQASVPSKGWRLSIHTPADYVYGFIIDMDCLRRWAKVFYDEAYGPEKLASMSPEEAKREIELARAYTSITLQKMVYRTLPHIPRLYHRLVLLSPTNDHWLLVLKDNGSHAAITAKITPEDIESLKKLIGLGEQRPLWYRLPSW